MLKYIVKYTQRKYDKGCCKKNSATTKCVNVSQYIKLYGGPEHQIYVGYSFIIKWVYVALFLGITFPIVFPMALFAISNQIVSERLTLVYFYRAPINYDKKLVQRARIIVRKSALLGLMFGYWALGNPAMFLPCKQYYRQFSYEILNPHHPILELSKQPYTA